MFEKGKWYYVGGYHILCVRNSYDGILRFSRKYKFVAGKLEITIGESLIDFDLYVDNGYITESDPAKMKILEEIYVIKDEIDANLGLTYESIINHLRNKENECR